MATLSLPTRPKLSSIEKEKLLLTVAEVDRAKKIKLAQEWLKQTYLAFSMCLPLDTGVHVKTIFDCPKTISHTTLSHARRLWCGSERYLKALAAEGSRRYELNGTPAGAVSDEHRAAAKEELAKRLRDAFKK